MVKILIAGILALTLWKAPHTEKVIQSDPKAKVILDKTSANLKALKTLKADLDITMEVPNQAASVQKAVVYISGQSYRLELADEIIICDNKSVWRYLKSLNEVQISDYDPTDDQITPTNIFNIYENDFYYLYTEKTTINGAEFHVIDLTPMDKNKSFFKVRIWVSTTDSFIHQMKVFDKNGSRYTYKMTKMVKNGVYKTSTFMFNKADYPGVHVEDLRF
jgi:outer membrane lipoprotein-sorting protein